MCKSSTTSSRKRNSPVRFAGAALFALSATAQAIEAPNQPAPAPTAQPAPAREIAASDQSAFYARLQRSEHARALSGLEIEPAVIDELAQGNAAAAVRALGAKAQQGDHDANIALVRLQHWCNRIVSGRAPDPDQQIAKLSPALQGERAAKAAGVIRAEAAFRDRARQACINADFDFGGIEARLREAAAAGHPASATELAQFVRDPRQRKALLDAALEKDYAPAQYHAATTLLKAVQRGDTTENVSSIRALLKQAGRTLPKAKLDLANCMALGCDGHPADALTAKAFGLDAARDGEPTAFLSMIRMPWGRRLARTEHLAWQQFGERLNENGCFGESYVGAAANFAQTLTALEKGQSEQTLAAAKQAAEKLWREHGERAMREQGCLQPVISGGSAK